MGHVGSCDSTIKLPRTLNSTTIRCGPAWCAQSASGLDTSTLKLSTRKVQNDHATSTARHTATCPQARTPIDTMREDSMLVTSTRCPIAEFGQVSAWLDTSGMRAMHGEMTQSQRVESDRHKGSPSRLVWCVIARQEHLHLQNGRKQREQRRNARLPWSWWSRGSSFRLLGVAGHLECTCHLTYLRSLLCLRFQTLWPCDGVKL